MDTRNDRANRKYNNLFRLENELYHDIAVKMGLSDSAFGILYWLDDLGDGCLQRDVCVASGLTKQTVNSSVHKLERTGFVELRVEQGRGTHLHLTEAGRALAGGGSRDGRQWSFGWSRAAFVAMGSRDSEELLRLTHLHLELLREQVEALPYPDGR